VAPGQRLLHALLLFDEPVEGAVKLLLIDSPEPEHLAQRASRRLLVEQTRRRQLRGGLDQACNDHGDAQRHFKFGLPATLRQQPIEPIRLSRPMPRALLHVGANTLSQIGDPVDESDFGGQERVGGVFDQFRSASTGVQDRRLVEVERR
jgi:hypothetical protein